MIIKSLCSRTKAFNVMCNVKFYILAILNLFNNNVWGLETKTSGKVNLSKLL